MQPCHWYEDGEGGRYLIPGCSTRASDPDLEACTCLTLADQLDKARAEIDALSKRNRGLQSWHDAIVAAVYAHPDGVHIMKNAADRASRKVSDDHH